LVLVSLLKSQLLESVIVGLLVLVSLLEFSLDGMKSVRLWMWLFALVVQVEVEEERCEEVCVEEERREVKGCV